MSTPTTSDKSTINKYLIGAIVLTGVIAVIFMVLFFQKKSQPCSNTKCPPSCPTDGSCPSVACSTCGTPKNPCPPSCPTDGSCPPNACPNCPTLNIVKYVNPSDNFNYTKYVAIISKDGNIVYWFTPSGNLGGTWARAKPLSIGQDPTILSGGELPMSDLPVGYYNDPETGITTYNWTNTGNKTPILILPYNKPNMYYMKQGKHYDLNRDVLIVDKV
jgi:hypothetical protein